MTTTPDISPEAVERLRDYQQADEEGIMVLASRQAIDEVCNGIDALSARVAELEAALERTEANRDAILADLAELEDDLAQRDRMLEVACNYAEEIPARIKLALFGEEFGEKVAERIYRAMRFDRQNDTPEWEASDDSEAQMEARACMASVTEMVRDEIRALAAKDTPND